MLLIILGMLFVSQGCRGNVAATPSKMIRTTTETMLLTVTETPSPKPSVKITATPDDIATANFIETASVSTLIATTQPSVIATYPSSDGKWRVEVIRYDCVSVYHNSNESIAYEQLRLVNLSDGTQKFVADQRQSCGGVGAFGLNGLYWSPSNRYFYYNESREGYPDGGCGGYIPPIYRLDPLTQEVITLEGGFISPDKTKLALWQGTEIAIWDLDRGEIARLATLHPNLLNGRIWWSAKSDSIVYLQTDAECLPGFGKFYLVTLDLTNGSQNLITKYELANTGFVVTPAPAGVFVFFFYSPLIMNYDPSIWTIKNALQAKELASCNIAEQGPTDFNGPHTSEVVLLGNVNYEVLSLPDSSEDVIRKVYIADQSLTTDWGLPVFWVSAKSDEWDHCKPLAEKVLSTLRFPP
jgi:hypothetical protein